MAPSEVALPHNVRSRSRAWACALLLATGAAPTTASATAGFQLNASTNRSDNIARTPEPATEDTVSELGTTLAWSNQSARLSADAFVQLSYLDFLHDTFDDQAVPRADLAANWTIAPARLAWVVEERYGQIASDPFAPLIPDNIENTNVFRTGPDFTFGSNSSQLLTIGLRAEDQYYETQSVDNQRGNATLRYTRRLTPLRSISFTAMAEHVDFEQFGLVDYDLLETYATLEQSLNNSLFTLDVGRTGLDINDADSDGLLARLSVTRAFGPRWNIEAGSEYSYTDSGSRFLIGRQQNSVGPGQIVNDDSILAAASPIRLRSYSFTASRQSARQSFDLSLYSETERYEVNSEFNRDQAGGVMSLDHAMSPRHSVALRTNYRTVTFETTGREDNNAEVSLHFIRNLGKNLHLDFRLARLRRTSTEPTAEYDEKVIGINIVYQSDTLQAIRGAR